MGRKSSEVRLEDLNNLDGIEETFAALGERGVGETTSTGKAPSSKTRREKTTKEGKNRPPRERIRPRNRGREMPPEEEEGRGLEQGMRIR